MADARRPALLAAAPAHRVRGGAGARVRHHAGLLHLPPRRGPHGPRRKPLRHPEGARGSGEGVPGPGRAPEAGELPQQLRVLPPAAGDGAVPAVRDAPVAGREGRVGAASGAGRVRHRDAPEPVPAEGRPGARRHRPEAGAVPPSAELPHARRGDGGAVRGGVRRVCRGRAVVLLTRRPAGRRARCVALVGRVREAARRAAADPARVVPGRVEAGRGAGWRGRGVQPARGDARRRAPRCSSATTSTTWAAASGR